MGETTTVLETEFKSPRNMFQAHMAEGRPEAVRAARGAGSIHDDAVASKLGFKGGTVPGSVHMNQFVPLIVKIYGEKWFEQGTGSRPSSPRRPSTTSSVRAMAERGEERARLRQYNEQGDQICEETASLDSRRPRRGTGSPHGHAGPCRARPPAHPRRLKVGDKPRDIPLKVDREALLTAARDHHRRAAGLSREEHSAAGPGHPPGPPGAGTVLASRTRRSACSARWRSAS